jgi:hypothetical protein
MDIEIQAIFENMREQIGVQAQEIATLKAIIRALKEQQNPTADELSDKSE